MCRGLDARQGDRPGHMGGIGAGRGTRCGGRPAGTAAALRLEGRGPGQAGAVAFIASRCAKVSYHAASASHSLRQPYWSCRKSR